MRLSRQLLLIVIASTALVTLAINDVHARRGGGMSTAQKKALMEQMQKQQQYQQNVATAKQKKDKQTFDRFDLNKNGKLDPNEKPAWDKFWRDVRLGKEPHPYSTITQSELTANPNATTAAKAPPKKK